MFKTPKIKENLTPYDIALYGHKPIVLNPGIILLDDINSSEWFDVPEWYFNKRPKLRSERLPYGVCDSIDDFNNIFWYELNVSTGRIFCVTFKHIEKMPGESSGWRWDEWGPYIGAGKRTCEYLDDEPEFENGVFVFEIWETR